MWSRIHLIPLLQAEEDRDLVRKHFADRAREKALLGRETSPYNSDRYVGRSAILRSGEACAACWAHMNRDLKTSLLERYRSANFICISDSCGLLSPYHLRISQNRILELVIILLHF